MIFTEYIKPGGYILNVRISPPGFISIVNFIVFSFVTFTLI